MNLRTRFSRSNGYCGLDIIATLWAINYFLRIVIQVESGVVLIYMLNDKQCKKIFNFMVAVIITFATTGLTIINSVN